MKVLQVNKFFYLKGGSEAYLFSLINGLRETGHAVAEFAMHDDRNHQSPWSKFFVSAVDYATTNSVEKIKSAGKIIYSIEAKNKIAQVLDTFRPDLVHLHIFQHQLSASILPEIKKRKIPILYTAHDLKSICPNYKMLTHGVVCEACRESRFYHCLIKKCVKESYLKSFINVVEMYFHYWRRYYDLIDLIITPSSFYRDKLVEWKFHAEKVVHIPNFIDEEQFTPNYENQGYFIYLGRLSEEKGVLTLIKAMEQVPKGKLIIIGTGPLENEIKNQIALRHLSNVEMAGFKSGATLKKYIANAMFSVMPSEWYENGPISLLENFAFGKPVIGSDIGGIPENITHGTDGLIFRPKDSDDLADKINFLLDNQGMLPKMGKMARQKIERIYSKNKHLEAITEVYTKLAHHLRR